MRFHLLIIAKPSQIWYKHRLFIRIYERIMDVRKFNIRRPIARIV